MTSIIPIFAMLTLTGAASLGEDSIPTHIVQPLPPELNPQYEAPLSAPSDIVRPLSAQETDALQQRNADFPSSAQLRDTGLEKIADKDRQDATTDAQIDAFRQLYHVAIHANTADVQAVAEQAGEQEKAETPLERTVPQQKTAEDLYHINCDEGVYFDMSQGLLVYMKNVRVRNPRLSLDCNGPLKCYLEQDEKKDKAKKKTETEPRTADKTDTPKESKTREREGTNKKDPVMPNGGNFDFNSLKKLSASGDVVVHYTDEKGVKNKAQADKMTYDAKTGEIILFGNYPFMESDGNIVRCPNKDGFIRIYGNGNIYVSSGAETTFKDMDKQLSDQGKNKNKRR